MAACKDRWRIRKRDGVWQAFDPDGNLRYAAAAHRMVMAFVMTQPRPTIRMPRIVDHPTPLRDGGSEQFFIVREQFGIEDIRKMLERNFREDENDKNGEDLE